MIYPIYVVKSLILWQNKPFYCINRAHYISNTPGTKFMKFGLKCPILHFKMDKTIGFKRIFFSLETFLESLQEIHVKKFQFLCLLLFSIFVLYNFFNLMSQKAYKVQYERNETISLFLGAGVP